MLDALVRTRTSPVVDTRDVDAAGWDVTTVGVLRLPSGRLVRGRSLRRPLPPGPAPDVGLYLLGGRAPAVAWESHALRWPDFGLPRDRDAATALLQEMWCRAEQERVEIACWGGRGRTGTALACLSVLDGVPRDRAVALVRRGYDARAVEMPWQRRYVTRSGR